MGRTDPYHCEWGVIVGDRIRRLRRDSKPDGGHYTQGFFSRMERGWASGPLVTYVEVAAQFGVDPGRLLGPDDAQGVVSGAEMALVELVRRLGLSPAAALARPTGGWGGATPP